MKVAITSVFCALITAIPLALAQDQAPSQTKSLIVFPVNGVGGVRLSALNIQRTAEYPSVIELRGDVEIRTRVCIIQGKTGSKARAPVCDGVTVVRADEAVFHEDTGSVDARGKVTITTVPYRR